MTGQHSKFDPNLKKTKKMKNGSKIQMPLHLAILCALVCGKNIKLAIQHVWKKNLHKFDYLQWTCVDFMAYAHGNCHIHGKIHDNKPKFGTTNGVTIVDNVA